MFPSTVPDGAVRDFAAATALSPTLTIERILPPRGDFADAASALAASVDNRFVSGFAAGLAFDALDAAGVADDLGFDLTFDDDFALGPTTFATIRRSFPASADRDSGLLAPGFLATTALDTVQTTAVSGVDDFVLLLALRSLWDDM